MGSTIGDYIWTTIGIHSPLLSTWEFFWEAEADVSRSHSTFPRAAGESILASLGIDILFIKYALIHLSACLSVCLSTYLTYLNYDRNIHARKLYILNIQLPGGWFRVYGL